MSQDNNPAPQKPKAEEAYIEQEDQLSYDSFSDNIDPVGAQEHQIDSSSIEIIEAQYKDKIAALESEVTAAKDQMMRAMAEAENARRRAQKDRDDASKFALSSFARDLLSVADNLRRALDAVPEDLRADNPPIQNLTNGIEATERELLRSFEKNGIEKIEPLDQPFDPNFHEVMFEAPMPDKPGGIVIQLLEPGYTINGRILRPARVGVSKSEQDTTPPPSQGPGQNVNTEV